MDSFLTLSNPFKQFQSFNQIIPAAYLSSATLNSYNDFALSRAVCFMKFYGVNSGFPAAVLSLTIKIVLTNL